jgi:hypothetical protein
MEVTTVDEIPFEGGGRAASGPAFLTRAVPGRGWSGTAKDLDLLDNPEVLTSLVIFDTWTLNRDRHAPESSGRGPNRDNVYFSEEDATEGRYRLIAMDHTHCFTKVAELTSRVGAVARQRDSHLYGLFPEFIQRIRRSIVLATTDRLRDLPRREVVRIVNSVPPEWEVSRPVRDAWIELICGRADYVAGHVLPMLERECGRLMRP